jgi:hypothetical protein
VEIGNTNGLDQSGKPRSTNNKSGGYVYSLDKDKRDPLGNVMMKSVVDGSYRTVRLALTEEDYIKAIHAHEGYQTIRVEGELMQRGRFRVLEKITSFVIETDGDSEDKKS